MFTFSWVVSVLIWGAFRYMSDLIVIYLTDWGEVLPSLPKLKKAVPGGLKYSYYEGSWDSLPDFSKLKPVNPVKVPWTYQYHK